eukprot:CAMPEP_0184710936 /NCGR_PEP_ID=MMETSP0314-20130426/1680_1 /TAXON_ID=38298 /ORGANISM="Rhodella maculata, Strain CCMP 736" /LENGTH=31 /DNA_ID= /DNA_START= /DNA_END= /DNA_ORIENTATION=
MGLEVAGALESAEVPNLMDGHGGNTISKSSE